MAVNTKMPLTNTADGYLCEGTDIRGGYFVIDKIVNIPNTITKIGSLCYCQEDSKFYQYNGNIWTEVLSIPSTDGLASEDFVETSIENKVDSSELEKYYTKTEADETFMTQTEVDTRINQVITDAVDGDTLTSLTDIVDYLNTHGQDAAEMLETINTLESDKADKSELFSKSYNDLTDKPEIPSLSGYATEDYVNSAIENIPEVYLSDYAKKDDLFSKDYNDLSNKPELFSGNYDDLNNKPTLPKEYDDSELRNLIDAKQDNISDLETIREGAALGKTALQSIPDTYATKDDLKDFVVSTEGSLFDNDIKLSEDIWTDKSIGYINGSTSSPKKVANAGDTLKTMFTNIFGTITDDTTNLVTNPKISSISIGNSYYEFGTKLDSVSVSITTNNGKYKYGPSTTGSTWTGNYTLSGDGFTTKNNSTSNTQNINLISTFIVGTSSELTLTVKRDYTAATTTALSKMGNNTTQKIEAGTAEGSETFNPTAKYYNYIAVTNSTSAPTTATASGVECNGEDYESNFTTTDNTYIWFLMPNKNKTKIQQFAMNQWNNVNTTYAGSIKFKLLSEAEVTYHAYRTDKMMSATGQYRIN